MFKKSSIFIAFALSFSVYANDPCGFSSVEELERVLVKIGIDPKARTMSDAVYDHLDGVENLDQLVTFLKDELEIPDLNSSLTPQFLSNFEHFIKQVNLDNMDAVLTKLKNISLDTELKLDFAMDLSRISEDIIDGNLFQNITFHSTSGVLSDHYPFLTGRKFDDTTYWDEVSMYGGLNNRPEIVINENLEFTAKDSLYAVSSALNKSSLNSSLQTKLSDTTAFQNAWYQDIHDGNITQAEFSDENNLDRVFNELFYRVNKRPGDKSWTNLTDYYKNELIPNLDHASPESKINYHGVPNYIDLAYNKMDANDPIHYDWLKREGFIDEHGNIDQVMMDEEGNGFPILEATISKKYQPLEYLELKKQVTLSLKNHPDYQDVEVVLWRGTSGENAQNIARYKTAGGERRTDAEVPRPSQEDTDYQVAFGSHIPEYSTRYQTVDGYSNGHYAVAVKVKLKYLRPASEFEQGFATYKNTPVDVLLIIDRTNGLPEAPSTGNGS